MNSQKIKELKEILTNPELIHHIVVTKGDEALDYIITGKIDFQNPPRFLITKRFGIQGETDMEEYLEYNSLQKLEIKGHNDITLFEWKNDE